MLPLPCAAIQPVFRTLHLVHITQILTMSGRMISPGDGSWLAKEAGKCMDSHDARKSVNPRIICMEKSEL